MRILRSIVAPSTTLVAFCDPKISRRCTVRSQIICDELVWDKAIFLQQLAHQFERRPPVPPGLDQHVKNFALGIHGTPEVQQSREFASTDPPTRTQDARVQEPGLSPEISLNPRSHLQYLQRPTPSHFSQNTPSLSCVGYGHVARGSRGRLKSSRCRILAFFFRQRDRARGRAPRNPGAKGM